MMQAVRAAAKEERLRLQSDAAAVSRKADELRRREEWGGGGEGAFMVLSQQHDRTDDFYTQWGKPRARGTVVDEEGPAQGRCVRKASLDQLRAVPPSSGSVIMSTSPRVKSFTGPPPGPFSMKAGVPHSPCRSLPTSFHTRQGPSQSDRAVHYRGPFLSEPGFISESSAGQCVSATLLQRLEVLLLLLPPPPSPTRTHSPIDGHPPPCRSPRPNLPISHQGTEQPRAPLLQHPPRPTRPQPLPPRHPPARAAQPRHLLQPPSRAASGHPPAARAAQPCHLLQPYSRAPRHPPAARAPQPCHLLQPARPARPTTGPGRGGGGGGGVRPPSTAQPPGSHSQGQHGC